MEKQIVIVGAGISGILACKYLKHTGFNPILFEASDSIGGVWAHTMESTRLQNTKHVYQFSDFPWPDSVTDLHPTSFEMVEYMNSYVEHFGVSSCIRFNSNVLGIDYVGGESEVCMRSWQLWGGNGLAFSPKAKWQIRVRNTKDLTLQVYHGDFVVLCIGAFSGLPNYPDFLPNEGPEVFKGKVLHVMDYSDMDKTKAAELVNRKRVTVVGSHKSGMDLAAECANTNGVEYPCTVIKRSAHWTLVGDHLDGLALGFLYLNRFAELMVHKPAQSLRLFILATLLSPLRWVISMIVETYLKWRLPLKKYGMVPKESFNQDIDSCKIALLPPGYYDRVAEGSIVIKHAQGFRFCKEGLIIDGESNAIKSDVVIFATGYKGDEKLRNILDSPYFQKMIMGSPNCVVPLYRQILPPRIPRVAIIGFVDSLSAMGANEIKCQWLVKFLKGKIDLPTIKEMEKEAEIWGNYIKKANGRYYRRSCISSAHIWYNDQLCKDMGCNPHRKKGFFTDLFCPYEPTDYAGLVED